MSTAKWSMPQQLKQAWVSALLSGKFKQGTGTMYRPETDAYCCLGVLRMLTDNPEQGYDDLRQVLRAPSEDHQACNLDYFEDFIARNDGHGRWKRHLNPQSFEHIARFIKRNVKGV